MELSLKSIQDRSAWSEVSLPQYDMLSVRKKTVSSPEWLHFGAGNIFRGFIASLSQKLLNDGIEQTGIIAADTFD